MVTTKLQICWPFFSIRDFNTFLSFYLRSGCVSEVAKLPAYSVACSRSSMESLPPPVSWNSLTSRRPMGKPYLLKLFPYQRKVAKMGGKWQKSSTWKLCWGLGKRKENSYACHVRSISIWDSNRYRQDLRGVGHVPFAFPVLVAIYHSFNKPAIWMPTFLLQQKARTQPTRKLVLSLCLYLDVGVRQKYEQKSFPVSG